MVILSSPSGAGKTTLVKLLSENKKFHISTSHTTRKPRPNEIPDQDYYFVNQEKFVTGHVTITSQLLVFEPRNTDEHVKKDGLLTYQFCIDVRDITGCGEVGHVTRVINTKHKITIDYNDGSGETTENTDNNFYVTKSYGFDVGIEINVNESLTLDLHYERAYGGEASYIDYTTVSFDADGNVDYQMKRTKTNANIFSIGLVF